MLCIVSETPLLAWSCLTGRRDTFKEFYNVIIDINAFKKFITDYKQYFIYKTIINNNINIDII